MLGEGRTTVLPRMLNPDKLDFAKSGGLIPVVVQDAATLQVLTLAYMDRAALDETIASSEAATILVLMPAPNSLPPACAIST